jgi:hypothetical protein
MAIGTYNIAFGHFSLEQSDRMLLGEVGQRPDFAFTFAMVKVHDVVGILHSAVRTRFILRRSKHGLQPEIPPVDGSEVSVLVLEVVLPMVRRLTRAAIRLIFVRSPLLLPEVRKRLNLFAPCAFAFVHVLPLKSG